MMSYSYGIRLLASGHDFIVVVRQVGTIYNTSDGGEIRYEVWESMEDTH